MATAPIRHTTILAALRSDTDFAAFQDIILPCGSPLHRGRTLADIRRLLDREPIDVVISDVVLADDHDWKDVLNAVESGDGFQPLIVVSRCADEFLWAEVLNLGGFDVLPMPFDREEVARIVECAFRERLRKPAPRRNADREFRVRPVASRARA